MSDVDVLVLGGGPTGLGAAWRLAKHPDVEWLLCEADDVLGGLSRSFLDNAGYTWDIGGHVCFSHYDVFTAALTQALGDGGSYEHDREAWVHCRDTWVPYPFQNNLHRLDPITRDACLAGLVEAARVNTSGVAPVPASFAEFIVATFGPGIAEAFMTPYNHKVWATELEQMSYEWIGERVSVPDPERARRNVEAGVDDLGWGPNNRFVFPKSGGTGAFWTGIASLLPPARVRTSARAVHVDAALRRVEFADGSTVSYRNLITTLPLDVTARMLGDGELIAATSALTHNSVNVVGLGVDPAVGARLGTWCWMYFPGDSSRFYRVTNFSHYSPAHAPKGRCSLILEVAESAHQPVDHTNIVDDVILGLVAEGVLDDAEQVSHTWSHRAEYGYPIPTIGRDDIVAPTLAALEKQGILSRGRFGAWRYEVGNMDHSFMQGYEAVAHVLDGASELTVYHPSVVNTPHPTLGWGRIK